MVLQQSRQRKTGNLVLRHSVSIGLGILEFQFCRRYVGYLLRTFLYFIVDVVNTVGHFGKNSIVSRAIYTQKASKSVYSSIPLHLGYIHFPHILFIESKHSKGNHVYPFLVHPYGTCLVHGFHCPRWPALFIANQRLPQHIRIWVFSW